MYLPIRSIDLRNRLRLSKFSLHVLQKELPLQWIPLTPPRACTFSDVPGGREVSMGSYASIVWSTEMSVSIVWSTGTSSSVVSSVVTLRATSSRAALRL